MKLALIGAVVTALTVAIAAFASTRINGADRANAARACTALRTANSSAFAMQYARFGACTSQWVHKAHTTRVVVQATCRSKGLSGGKLAACVRTATRTNMATEVTTAENAAKACAAERASLGTAAFEKKYGANGNLRNAFGKCVSQKASSGNQSSGGGAANQAAQHFAVTLGQLNNSGVSGMGSLTLKGGMLHVKLSLTGLQAGQSHAIAIRGLATGSASCPTAAADTNHDGTLSLSEGQPVFGDVLLALDPSTLSAGGSSTSMLSSLSPLQTRTIVALGLTANGSYDATLPVSCGTIALK